MRFSAAEEPFSRHFCKQVSSACKEPRSILSVASPQVWLSRNTVEYGIRILNRSQEITGEPSVFAEATPDWRNWNSNTYTPQPFKDTAVSLVQKGGKIAREVLCKHPTSDYLLSEGSKLIYSGGLTPPMNSFLWRFWRTQWKRNGVCLEQFLRQWWLLLPAP